jgi:hypothetical protein
MQGDQIMSLRSDGTLVALVIDLKRPAFLRNFRMKGKLECEDMPGIMITVKGVAISETLGTR